jgi:hypothetical protein
LNGGLALENEDAMSKAKKNAEREHRIEMEIIVDANGPEEQAMEEARYFGSSFASKTNQRGGLTLRGRPRI